jgi:cation diffusion facilitator CzcD-associated flavoprotein CzcO
MDRAFSAREKALFREYPLLRDALRASIWARRELFVFGFRNPRVMQLVERFAVDYLERTVKDETLRARLRPSFRLGCKRILVTSDYLPALNRDNVHVFASAVERFEDGQLVTADGRRHSLDVLIFATGFQVTDMPMSHVVLGRDGRTLAEHWQGSPRAHLGTMVHSFPNLFLMTGPNTGLGHSSMVFMIESQLNLVEGALRHARAQPSCTIEPTRAAQQAWVDEVQRRTRGTVWINGGCASWYLDAAGNNATLWPGFTLGFRRRARFRKSEYAITRGSRE